MRGNTGGEDKPGHIAKRLYENVINPYKRCEIKDTPLSNYFLHQHGAYRRDNLAMVGLDEKDLIIRCYFSGKNQILFDDTSTYYPFNPEKGYKGKIDILLDRHVASAAESAYTSFYHHPNVRYEGGHFLLTNTQIWKDLESIALSSGKHLNNNSPILKTIDIFTAYFDANPNEKCNKSFSSKIAVLDVINEAFACCSNTFFCEKRDVAVFADKKVWYYGFEAANKLAPQVYPLFKEYIAQGKTMDDMFFKRLNDNLKGFESGKESALQSSTPSPLRLTGFNNGR